MRSLLLAASISMSLLIVSACNQDSAEEGTSTTSVSTVAEATQPQNSAPEASHDSFSVDEGSMLDVAAPGILDNDSDGDGDVLMATLATDVSDGSLALNADGSFSYTPDPGFSGSDSFIYAASDGTLSDKAIVTITVEQVNEAPVADDDSYSIGEGSTLDVAAPGVLDNDSDADGDALVSAVDADVSEGSLTLNADGSFSYTPDAGFSGTDSFTYEVSDGSLSDTATVTITVTPVSSEQPSEPPAEQPSQPNPPSPPPTGRAVGFGAGATGGDTQCVVRSLADSGAGSLRECAEAGGQNVSFAVSGTIDLGDEIDVASNTTINGFGQDVTVVGMLDVKEVENVIIRHLTVTGSGEDAIRVIRSRTLWFDHLEVSNSADGLIDITNGSTDVTISWSHFHSHDKMVLVNPGDTGVTARVTLHHNWFDNGGRRYPSAEGSDVHGFNNFYDGWSNYGVSITEGARFVGENSVYRASSNDRGLITNVSGEVPGDAVSSGDIIEGDVVLEVRGSAFTPPYSYSLDPATSVVSIVTAGAGPNN